MLNQLLKNGEYLKKFNCLMCSDCCIFKYEYEMPHVFPWEKRVIIELNSNQLFKPHLIYRDGDLHIIVLYKWIINGKCIFLNSNNKCRIHSNKPFSCKIFPLIINLSDNTLRVSNSCKFINENIDLIKSTNPDQVFINEYLHALKTYIFLKIIDEFALNNNWERIVVSNIIDLNKIQYIDIDHVIDTNSLMNSIEKSLIKYSEKPS